MANDNFTEWLHSEIEKEEQENFFLQMYEVGKGGKRAENNDKQEASPVGNGTVKALAKSRRDPKVRVAV